MWATMHEYEIAKILVLCHQDAILCICEGKQLFVGGLRMLFRGGQDIMSKLGQRIAHGTRSDAYVK